MNKMIMLLVPLFVLGSCVGVIDSTSKNIFPDLDYVVFKKRTVHDREGNIIDLTFLGLKKNNKPTAIDPGGQTTTATDINVYIIWSLRVKRSLEYKISFTVSDGNSDYFIRTADGGIFPISAVVKGPLSPSTIKANLSEGGLIVLTFPDFKPEKNPLFDLVEGGRRAVNTAAYKAYIKDPTRWSFFGCRAVRGGGQ